jgi:hypothetical protein
MCTSSAAQTDNMNKPAMTNSNSNAVQKSTTTGTASGTVRSWAKELPPILGRASFAASALEAVWYGYAPTEERRGNQGEGCRTLKQWPQVGALCPHALHTNSGFEIGTSSPHRIFYDVILRSLGIRENWAACDWSKRLKHLNIGHEKNRQRDGALLMHQIDTLPLGTCNHGAGFFYLLLRRGA